MDNKRITVFMGHYGSGKTFVSVNYAISLAKKNLPVSIYDLDIVNPYFRTVDAKEKLKKENVELVVSPFAQTNVDIPAMNSKAYKMVDDLTRFAVADIGGDDRGALALGRFSDKIKKENNYEALLVVNKCRPETNSKELVGQKCVGILGLGNNQQSRGILIYAVHQSRADVTTTLLKKLRGAQVVGQSIDQRTVPIAVSGVDNHTRTFVDNQQLVIFIDNFDGNILGDECSIALGVGHNN